MTGFSPTCPECHRPWDERQELIGEVATGFSDCAFRCHPCGIAFSNAVKPQGRVRITRTPELNVPAEARAGLGKALDGAVTVGNRIKKRKKFCSATSEDAVTWTLVRGLLEAGRVSALVSKEQLGEPQAVLTWGYPVAGPAAADAVARLLKISDALGENVIWRSEPDVHRAMAAAARLHRGEVRQRQRSPAQLQGLRNVPARPRPLRLDDATVASEGSYQLTRNWVIGTRMAEDLSVPFQLINLGPAAVSPHAAKFRALLAETPETPLPAPPLARRPHRCGERPGLA
jgi:hypothetical protein